MAKMRLPRDALPSERTFGLFFGIVCLVAASFAWCAANPLVSVVLGCLALTFTMFACIKPRKLRTLNALWFGLGLLIGRIVSPIILGFVFFILITPIGIVMRAFGRDELRIKKRSVASYWIQRSSKGPSPDSFKDQF